MVRQPYTEKAHERQPIADLELGRIIGQVVQRLEHQHPEHERRIKRRTTALAPVAAVLPSGTDRPTTAGTVHRGGLPVQLPAPPPPLGVRPHGTAHKGVVRSAVETGSIVSTDELVSYGLLAPDGFKHGQVNHGEKDFAHYDFHRQGPDFRPSRPWAIVTALNKRCCKAQSFVPKFVSLATLE